MKRVLTIAGAAAQGSAGIQADLKVFQERKVYGMTAITATVANNSRTKQGIFIREMEEIEAQFFAATEMVGVDAVKTGMLFSEEIIERVAELLQEYPPPVLVVDPVMVGKMGSQLLADHAIESLIRKLVPLATVITPNRLEAAHMLHDKIPETKEELEAYAKRLFVQGAKAVVIKGGVIDGKAIDILYDGKEWEWMEAEAIDTIHTSGAGCSFAACLTAELAKGKSLKEAVYVSKKFVHEAIKHSLSFGKGIGSVNHGAFQEE
ncbi:bifunctional hydroxymethylpyrimidine kinase/phosphomethylpyrimidine kinase [Gracilibacillus oryzae]|uniref:pyridoxal kinase n=1 Tax=Gracilibacillus oryzae TaxID=1672701 RepID=A0A7C8KR34_9BACI|nr:bifunctional hydroxymethylpyrimidine kinase/phosphomethylpyrimidine kinase [Gracilibacillus oryzae]KAB8137905.1 bifunctional hydroxymethylpyrimidine kinase/phosphomethylpyrimidine kinase [Gracilibacillus oryzae]